MSAARKLEPIVDRERARVGLLDVAAHAPLPAGGLTRHQALSAALSEAMPGHLDEAAFLSTLRRHLARCTYDSDRDAVGAVQATIAWLAGCDDAEDYPAPTWGTYSPARGIVALERALDPGRYDPANQRPDEDERAGDDAIIAYRWRKRVVRVAARVAAGRAA